MVVSRSIFRVAIISVLVCIGCSTTTVQTRSQHGVSVSLKANQLDARPPASVKYNYPESPRSSLAPLILPGGSTVSIITPDQWLRVARSVQKDIRALHQNFSSLYGQIPASAATVELIESERFYRTTGAPRWTNAMYYKGKISIPVPLNKAIEVDALVRSVRHEYTHSMVHSLSHGKCPGWIDEGIAQMIEGQINPALEPSLRAWLQVKRPVSLRLLQGGFTKLNSNMVAPAYAQSLYASQMLLNRFRTGTLKKYFKHLRSGEHHQEAFENAFGMSEARFELVLEKSLNRWAGSEAPLL